LQPSSQKPKSCDGSGLEGETRNRGITSSIDVEEALKPGAPILKDWGRTISFMKVITAGESAGDVDKGLAEADFIIESMYQTSPIEHAPTDRLYRQTRTGWTYNSYTNTQALFFTLDNTALILQVPFQKLHFVGGTVGGGFGGKVDVIVEPIATLAAMKTNRPVKYFFTREEEMRISSSRSAWRMYFKDGVKKDGRIVARKITSYSDAGAYNRHTPYAVTKHAANIAGPYRIPNVWIDAHCVYTNRQPSSAMRGLCNPASFALEVQMDKIAKTVGLIRGRSVLSMLIEMAI
jgi:CO/xanthine dehydrogenase Mo-binding subunit